MLELRQWMTHPRAETFPFESVIAAFRNAGKHFVAPELLALLALARSVIPAGDTQLRRFLDTALDKYDNRFDNPSYLALHDLPLPSTAGRCPLLTAPVEHQRDRLAMLLIADLLRFEIAALDGNTNLLPLMRPDARTVAKRCAHGARVLRPAMARLGLIENDGADAIDTVRRLCARVEAVMTPDDRRMLATTLLTVYVAHDENLFVRALQCYETTFALATVYLSAAVIAARMGDADRVVRVLDAATRAMDEVSPMFSLVATMRSEAFMAFREYTDGASAIQSRNYKMIESLCRRPDVARLVGPGYDAVPDVRARIAAGQPTLADAIEQARFTPDERTRVEAAMQAFEAEVLGWRKTHHNLAARMLGVKRGTGYTAGVPYLADGRDIPLFQCPFAGKRAA